MSLLKLLGIRSSKNSINIISVRQAHQGLIEKTLILFDVRQSDEWNETGRPQGSHGVTLQDDDFLERIAVLVNHKKDAASAVTCRSGARSMLGAKKLASDGYTNVSNVAGGFLEWEKQNLPLDKPPF